MNIHSPIDPKFDAILQLYKVPSNQWGYYKKWVQYFLHFCAKYKHNPTDNNSLLQFIEKLAEKKQTLWQQKQAEQAITYYSGFLKPAQQLEKKLPGKIIQNDPVKYFNDFSNQVDPIFLTATTFPSNPLLKEG